MSDVQAALQNIYDRHGHVSPEIVLKEASTEDSPTYTVLHGYFTWDDNVAAHRQRLFEARALIRRCRISVEASPERFVNVRAFLHVPRRSMFLPTAVVLNSDYRDAVLEQCRRDIAALRRKYEALCDFDQVLREQTQSQATP